MKYLQFTFTLTPSSCDLQDVLAAVLAEAGFDSFETAENGISPMNAYIKQSEYDESQLNEVLASFPIENIKISYTYHEAEDRDWNALWEQNYFQPLIVDGRCVVAGTMHHDVPKAEYRIIIDPRMSFGTGHHATTSQMLSELLQTEVCDRTVLDMGCGTGILAIMAKLRGAKNVLAIDNDEWCVSNTLDNIAFNAVNDIEVKLGDADILSPIPCFDIILANINRNILLADMQKYVRAMLPGALLFTSGYYTDDLPVLKSCAEEHGLTFVRTREQDRWACSVFAKQ